MSATELIQDESPQKLVTLTSGLNDTSVSTSKTTGEASVASTVASVASTVDEQIEIAQITDHLRKKLVPIFPEFSFSTGISTAEEVNTFAQMVNDLNRIRKSHLEEYIEASV